MNGNPTPLDLVINYQPSKAAKSDLAYANQYLQASSTVVNTDVKLPSCAEVIFPTFGFSVTSRFMRLCSFPFWGARAFWALVAV